MMMQEKTKSKRRNNNSPKTQPSHTVGGQRRPARVGHRLEAAHAKRPPVALARPEAAKRDERQQRGFPNVGRFVDLLAVVGGRVREAAAAAALFLLCVWLVVEDGPTSSNKHTHRTKQTHVLAVARDPGVAAGRILARVAARRRHAAGWGSAARIIKAADVQNQQLDAGAADVARLGVARRVGALVLAVHCVHAGAVASAADCRGFWTAVVLVVGAHVRAAAAAAPPSSLSWRSGGGAGATRRRRLH